MSLAERTRWPSLLAFAVAIAAACEEPATSVDGALKEIEPDCLACLQSLTECTSTVKNETQFVQCRDVFQACQDKMSLGPDECGRPSNQIACELCRERLGVCDGVSAPQGDCDLEFSVCKTFLMSSVQDECTAKQAPEQGDCGSCYGALAACASGGDEALVCKKTFYGCRNANLIEPADCPDPGEEQICNACAAQLDLCVAAASEACDEGFASCATTLEAACDAGAGGGGGGGPGPGGCSHDACEVGALMDPSCDPCIAAVCAADAYCCDTAYDDYCVTHAQEEAVCGCTPDVTCAHDPCEAGAVLDPSCDACVATVCEADGFCCNSEWDELCISRAEELCLLVCT